MGRIYLNGSPPRTLKSSLIKNSDLAGTFNWISDKIVEKQQERDRARQVKVNDYLRRKEEAEENKAAKKAERERIAEEKRVAAEAEKLRLAQEAENARLAEKKRIADKLFAQKKRQEEEARKKTRYSRQTNPSLSYLSCLEKCA